MNYRDTAEELCRRILALMPEHPEIMDMESPWELFGVDGFACGDLQPSAAQAEGALAKAKDIYRETK